MKFDMHCHTKEGSADGKVSIVDFAKLLKDKGFQGMLVTDHDSYDGYRYWRDIDKPEELKDFVVLKGIEYDTIDAGHMLVIMPHDVKLKILELRGLPVYVLMDIVHKHGGIIGPAHPFGERFLSIFHTGIYKYHNHIAKQFDFIECFNACEESSVNDQAHFIADSYGKAEFGGSDAHKDDCVGLAFTVFPEGVSIKSEDDLINYIKDGGKTSCGGERYYGTIKVKIGIFNHLLVQGFWFYNKFLGLFRRRKRSKELIQLKKYSDLNKKR